MSSWIICASSSGGTWSKLCCHVLTYSVSILSVHAVCLVSKLRNIDGIGRLRQNELLVCLGFGAICNCWFILILLGRSVNKNLMAVFDDVEGAIEDEGSGDLVGSSRLGDFDFDCWLFAVEGMLDIGFEEVTGKALSFKPVVGSILLVAIILVAAASAYSLSKRFRGGMRAMLVSSFGCDCSRGSDQVISVS